MTLNDLKVMDDVFITAEDAAKIMKVNPHSIRVQAKEDPRMLGFPCSVVGTRVKIPRIPFIKFLEG